jgi:predicted PurR-regulated permease PerM
MDDRPATTDAPAGRAGWRSEIAFLRRVLIVAAVVVLALALWTIRSAALMAFGSVVIAVLLLAAASPFERLLGLSRGWSLAAAGLAIAVTLLIVGLLLGNEIQSQVAELSNRLPQAVRSFERRFGVEVPTLGEAVAMAQAQGNAAGAPATGPGVEGADGLASYLGDIVSNIARFGFAVLDALAAFILIVVGGFFLAAQPGLYRQGLVKLLPVGQHARAEDALVTTGRAMHKWLIAQIISMTIVGTLVALGTWLIGLPAPLALALFAAMAEFVPIVGPIAAAVPPLLLSLTLGSGAFLWTLVLFIAIQQIESNIITPLVQERLVEIPPALLLFAVVAFGAILGIPGVLLAAPLTVVTFVLVKKLYVRQTLGEATTVPGEH